MDTLSDKYPWLYCTLLRRDGYGHIEIGDQEVFGFVVRALDYGWMVFEDDKPVTLTEGMAALEKGLQKWFDELEIDLHEGGAS